MFGFKKIGTGSFTNCYDMADGNVLLESIDNVKELFAYGWMPESDLLPRIESTDYDSNKQKAGEYCRYYKAPKYNKVRGYKKDLKKSDQTIYKQLKSFYDNLPPLPTNKKNCMYTLRDAVKASQLNNELSELLFNCFDCLGNYGTDFWFEISPQNIATDNKGDLILLDCFYYISTLNKTRS